MKSQGDVAGYDISLLALLVAAATGIIFILVFSCAQAGFRGNLAALALMTAGAAGFCGGLIGFLFGVPHSRDQEAPKTDAKSTNSEKNSDPGPSYRYKPNTSLEQISDWLSKIIVGVGLVEIKSLARSLDDVGKHLASGFSGHVGADVFFSTLLIYYLVCGFVFGFLWARIYLRRWFEVADANAVQKLNEEVSDIKSQLERDALAFGLISAQLSRGVDDEKANDGRIAESVRDASVPVKIQVFNMAERASRDKEDKNYPLRVETAISIFRGLILDDVDRRFHRNYSELAYALRSENPPDLQGAVEAISKAIEIRKRLSISGWRYYEFSRARGRIDMDSDFQQGRPSSRQNVDLIVSDLRVAASDSSRWKRWLNDHSDVANWMTLNSIDL
jgi:hypothetical protein